MKAGESDEQQSYLSVPGAYLYAVMHQAIHPRARVILFGPFASERQFAYNIWVRWARYLAARGVEVLRYDHRGTGESTGSFEAMTFEQWQSDAHLVVQAMERRVPKLPLILHGLECGAIFAANCFHQGKGDALLMWSPPLDASLALRAALRRWASMEQLFESSEQRMPAADYIRRLESGHSIEVCGYQWSSELWNEAKRTRIPCELMNPPGGELQHSGPVKAVHFGKSSESLNMPYRRYEERQDLSELYASTLQWMEDAVFSTKSTQ